MARKKLQVFVSSTYIDMRQERQTAVEAILQAGHIPAGMELFAAGDRSQLDVIRRWIDESDVFMLILGGRYGSVDKDTGKSYIHLEYEHAINCGKPLFAVVASEACLNGKARERDLTVIEREHTHEYNDFRKGVLGRMCRFFDDMKDIKLAIHESLSSFQERDLVGWVKSSEVANSQPLVDEIGRLGEENQRLKAEAVTLQRELEQRTRDRNLVGEFSFIEIERALSAKIIEDKPLLDWLLTFEVMFVDGIGFMQNDLYQQVAPSLVIYGLVEKVPIGNRRAEHYKFTPAGLRFVALCRINAAASKA